MLVSLFFLFFCLTAESCKFLLLSLLVVGLVFVVVIPGVFCHCLISVNVFNACHCVCVCVWVFFSTTKRKFFVFKLWMWRGWRRVGHHKDRQKKKKKHINWNVWYTNIAIFIHGKFLLYYSFHNMKNMKSNWRKKKWNRKQGNSKEKTTCKFNQNKNKPRFLGKCVWNVFCYSFFKWK